MSNRKGSDLFIDILEQYDVEYIFGNPGTTELPIIQSSSKSDKVDYIMTMHEDIAVSAATGHSLGKLDNNNDEKNPLTVVNLHSTPGLLHGLSNIYNGTFDKAPVIITTGSQNRNHEQRNPPLSGDKMDIINSIVKWSGDVTNVKDMPNMMRTATKKALTPPMSPVFLDITMDSQRSTTDKSPIELGDIPKIQNMANINSELINDIIDSDDPIIFVGDDITRSNSDTIQHILDLAHKIGARVYGEVLTSRTVYDYSDDMWVGSLTPKEDPSHIESDLEIHLGCNTNTTLIESNIKENNSKKIAVSNDLSNLDVLPDFEYTLYGNISQTVKRINSKLSNYSINLGNRLNRVKNKRTERLEKFDDRDIKSDRTSQMDICDKLTNVLDSGDIIFDEGVTTGFVLRNYIERSDIKLFGLKGGGLGQGIGSAIGLSLSKRYIESNPNIVALIGDGTFNYYPQGLFSATKYCDNITYIVPNNSGYKILRDNDMIESEEDTVNFNQIDIPKISEGYGVKSYNYLEQDDLEEFLGEVIRKDEVNLAHIPTK